MNLQDKLEEIKHMGSYSVSVYYGEGVGCDDIAVEQDEVCMHGSRNVRGWTIRGYSKRRSIPGGEDMKYKNFAGVAPVFSTLYFQPVG